jgi:hypothetical protein
MLNSSHILTQFSSEAGCLRELIAEIGVALGEAIKTGEEEQCHVTNEACF